MKKLSSKTFFGAVIVCILTFLFFLPNLLIGKVPIPADDLLGLYHPWRDQTYDGYNVGKFPVKNPLITDPVLQTYPWRNLAVFNIKEGNLPLWNPYSFSGQPLLANIQSSTFQVFNIFFFIFPFKIAWSIQIILPPILTSLLMFFFLRNLKISPVASVFGGFVLPFSGFFIAWLTWGTIVTTAVWLPLILLSLNKLFNKQSVLWFFIIVFSASQTIFAGHAQTALYVFLATLMYFAFLIYKFRKLTPTVLTIVALILGILVSSVQLLPALEFIKLSAREVDQSYYPQRPDWFLPIQHFIQLIAPDFFGSPTTYNYWGVWNWAEFVSFIGIIPLALALLTILKKKPHAIFFIFLAVISIILALANPISKIPYLLKTPFLSSLQPSRILFLFVFAMSVLSAYGLDYFLKNKKDKKIFVPQILIFFVLLLLVIYTVLNKNSFPTVSNISASSIALRNLALPIVTVFILFITSIFWYFNLSKKLIILVLFAVTLGELFRFGYKFTSFSKLSWIFPETKSIQYLTSQEKPFRIMSTDRRILHPNTSSVFKIESVDGYDPLFLKDYAQLVSSWQSGKPAPAGSFNRIVTPQKYDSQIANFLNVKYVLTFDELSSSDFEKIIQEGDTKVYLNKNVLPRAFFVNQVVKVTRKEQELAKLLDKNFDIKTSAVSSSFEFPKQDIKSSLSFTEYFDQSFKLLVNVDKQAPLILSNVYYPGWQAYVDGNKTEIKKVNFMFQSVIVPEGQHEVEFKFRSQTFYSGLYLSTVGVVLTALSALYLWRKYQ